MHIPDGYLSPATCAVFYAAVAPLWYMASRKVERSLKLKQLPILALGAAFTFVIMMFNIPIPGGSTGHMLGTVVVSIAMGPWAASVAVSLTLALQAFFFADGGLTTLAANCFNMAFLMSFTGYSAYRLLTAGDAGPGRRFFASALAAYAGVNMAALAVAVELGIQPIIASEGGRALYAPYPLSISIPAMMLPHLFFFGVVEAAGTALVISYVCKMNEKLIHTEQSLKPLWAILIVLAILTPLGLLASGTPWGEWGREEIIGMAGYLPAGMERLGDGWRGLLPDYGMPGVEGFGGEALFYTLSALGGSVLVVLAVYLWGRLWRR